MSMHKSPNHHDEIKVAKSAKALKMPTRIAIHIQSGNGPQIQSISLLDRCVQHQLMSHQTWTLIGKPFLYFVPSTTKTIIDSIGTCVGVLYITLNIGSHSKTGRFYVMAPSQLHEEVVLGKKWMAQPQCYRGITKLLLSISGDNEPSLSVPLVLDDQGLFSNPSIPLECQMFKPMCTSIMHLDKGNI